MSLTTTDTRSKRYALQAADGSIISHGELPAGNYLATSHTVIADEDPGLFLGALPVAEFPALPDSGWLNAGEIYQHGDGCVMVRQPHNRTAHDPADVPALFLVHRTEAGLLEWVAGEAVTVGDLRTYEGTTYRCIQSHVTQADWTPDATPALWVEHVEPGGDEWAPGVAYTIGDIVTYEGAEYECQQSHTSLVGWEPPNVPALWLEVV